MSGFKPRTSGSEATTLPTEPQPLPFPFDVLPFHVRESKTMEPLRRIAAKTFCKYGLLLPGRTGTILMLVLCAEQLNTHSLIFTHLLFRLFFAERLLEERIPLPCCNAELGCKIEHVADRIRKHETEECPFGLLRSVLSWLLRQTSRKFIRESEYLK